MNDVLNWLRRTAQALKRDAITLYFAARDTRVPWYTRALVAAIAAYALSPIDLIPDFIPVLGYVDELILLPVAIAGVTRLIDPEVLGEHRAIAAAIAERPVSKACAAAIIAIWMVTLALIARALLS